ncbi:DegT/DnrJ/EryC1/StrS family aminotransferase [Thalassospira alkalitolerans]|uniref:DegT/DnrJ/EryC1/StrS family aminotransferase n=1 Tax=Thalassospira alkalitolerans TaxID=1293890 RepID=UPI0030EDF889|tara:strand:- start:55224 stop:56354 length:1131 start_codon:yes stop_codon:yes gene_type:complete
MKFIDVSPSLVLRQNIDVAISRVINTGDFILGDEVEKFEKKLSSFTGANHSVSCANGTDALTLVLMAEKIGAGDAVICPSFTFIATAEVVAQIGATPIFADVNKDTFTLESSSVENAVVVAKKLGLKVRAVIAVDLFGLPANYGALRELCKNEDAILIADAAQSFSAESREGKVGTLADYTTLSFFPTKPLGCFGDGGAVLTNNGHRADLLRSLRFHGKGEHKYSNIVVGVNSRLDTLQAAILLEKLPYVEAERTRRAEIVRQYDEGVRGQTQTQDIPGGVISAFAQFTIVLPDAVDRRELIRLMSEQGVPTMVYYPIPVHRQIAYQSYPIDPKGLPVSELLADRVLSLPLHSKLSDADVRFVVDCLIAGIERVLI